ncbi:MAG: DNA-deoxyinosine glycosylase [Burkholderiaceae bacterium]|nr:DNA-deoxyinosine glycosylase [Burkholderiaceae bacterium]
MDAASGALAGLPPVVARNTRLLVLGSFPGVRSLQARQYYAHPQNHFWRILGALWSVDMAGMAYEARLDELRRRGLGLWDVYASCQRQGSLDSAIRQPRLNDFAQLKTQCPQLRAIAHNGGESFRHARATRALGYAVHRLPSSSPANASWSMARKCEAWAETLRLYGLLD